MSRLGRSQRHHRRPRTIYALVFPLFGACYVGQSVDVEERAAQHRRPAGGWDGASFELVELETVEATEAEAVELEYAWRLVAQRQGFVIYGTPRVVVDPSRRATLSRRLKSWRRRWPKGAPSLAQPREGLWVSLGLMMAGLWLMW